MALIKFSTPPTLAGLFFCLASSDGAGLFFLPGGVSATRKRLQRLFRRFALFHRTQYRSHTSRPYTACTAPEGIPSSAAPPPIQGQPGGCLDAFHARRFAVWHWVNGQSAPAGALHPAGQSSGRGTAGGAEPLTATAASSFGLSPDSQ